MSMNWDTFESLIHDGLMGQKESHRKVMSDFDAKAVKFVASVPERVMEGPEIVKDALTDDGKLAMPFPFIKLLDTNPDLGGGHHGYLIKKTTTGFTVIEIVKHEGKHALGKASLLVVHISEEALMVRAHMLPPKDDVDFFAVFIVPGRTTLTSTENIEVAKSGLGLVDRMCWFVGLVNTPGHYLAKVSPTKSRQAAHSVQWTEAKSHYIILDRSHSKALTEGKTRDFNGSMTRAMHWRRAHKRYLTSPRYQGKRFQSIFVRQAWVGPTEWEGNDRQVYKVINTKGEHIAKLEVK